MASAAPELVNVVAFAGDRSEFNARASGNPTVRANQISPERLAEIQAALKREARRLSFLFLLQYLKSQPVLFLKRTRFAQLVVRAYLKRSLNKLVARVAHRVPRYLK